MAARDWMPVAIWGNGGNEIIGWARVDRGDYEKVRPYRWWVVDGYACCSVTVDGFKTTMLMHRFVMDVPNGDPREVDHVNRNRMDNRRSNLQITDRWGNEENHDRSGLASMKRGVSFEKKTGRWRAQATYQGVYQHIGTFDTEEKAIAARMAWEERHGRVAKVEMNRLFPEEEQGEGRT